MYARIAYNVCMNSRQYTIRSIPEKLDRKLRKAATDSSKSLNQVLVEALEKGAGLSPEPYINHDFDWFFGINRKQPRDPGFEQAMEDFERIDEPH